MRVRNVKPFTTIELPKDSNFACKDGSGWTNTKWYVVEVYKHHVLALALDEHGKITNKTRSFDYGMLVLLGLEDAVVGRALPNT